MNIESRWPVRYPVVSLAWCGAIAFAACEDAPVPAEEVRVSSACEAACDTLFSADCPLPGTTPGLARQECQVACPTDAGDCVAARAAVFDCTAAAEVTCTPEGPVSSDGCEEELREVDACFVSVACRRYCEAAADAGCPKDGSVGACTADCIATTAPLTQCADQLEEHPDCLATQAEFRCTGKLSPELCHPVGVSLCTANEIDASLG